MSAWLVASKIQGPMLALVWFRKHSFTLGMIMISFISFDISLIIICTCIVFELLYEIIVPHGDGLLVSMSQDSSCCVHNKIFISESAIFINGLYICNC